MGARSKTPHDDLPSDDALITVCSACLCASCWQRLFMCEAARNASTRELTVQELTKLRREHQSYWGRR